jgi:hypothetical protein
MLNYTDDVDLRKKLVVWEEFYNVHRSHGGLGGKTPYEVLREKMASCHASIEVGALTSEVLASPDSQCASARTTCRAAARHLRARSRQLAGRLCHPEHPRASGFTIPVPVDSGERVLRVLERARLRASWRWSHGCHAGGCV